MMSSLSKRVTMMAQYKAAVTPLLTRWSYCSLALSHRHNKQMNINPMIQFTLQNTKRKPTPPPPHPPKKKKKKKKCPNRFGIMAFP